MYTLIKLLLKPGAQKLIFKNLFHWQILPYPCRIYHNEVKFTTEISILCISHYPQHKMLSRIDTEMHYPDSSFKEEPNAPRCQQPASSGLSPQGLLCCRKQPCPRASPHVTQSFPTHVEQPWQAPYTPCRVCWGFIRPVWQLHLSLRPNLLPDIDPNKDSAWQAPSQCLPPENITKRLGSPEWS